MLKYAAGYRIFRTGDHRNSRKISGNKKTSGSYENYQFEISVHEEELLIAFADITSLKMEEQKYFIFSLLAAFVLGILWIYPAWKITGK